MNIECVVCGFIKDCAKTGTDYVCADCWDSGAYEVWKQEANQPRRTVMTDNQSNERIDPETLSTNFYYTVGKEETFNCQFTVRGNPTSNEIATHIDAAIAAMKTVVARGGHAKQVGQGSAAASKTNGASAASASSVDGWEFKPKGGKTYIVTREGEMPESVRCPIHQGKTLKLKEGQYGPYLSHKDGSGWCNVGEWRN